MSGTVLLDCFCNGDNPGCLKCGGRGQVEKAACRRCAGTGETGGAVCIDCRGRRYREDDLQGWREREL